MSRRAGEERALRIGEVAERTGTTPRTIRYYEEIGLLPATEGRDPGAHRTYREDDVERLRDLLRLKDLLGVSLEDLRELVAAEDARATLRREWGSGIEDPVRRGEVLDEALMHIEGQLELVRHRREEIAKLESELTARRRRLRRLRSELEREVSLSR
jgi:MerR family transcriptional regulator, repressor of the yfmOP operon